MLGSCFQDGALHNSIAHCSMQLICNSSGQTYRNGLSVHGSKYPMRRDTLHTCCESVPPPPPRELLHSAPHVVCQQLRVALHLSHDLPSSRHKFSWEGSPVDTAADAAHAAREVLPVPAVHVLASSAWRICTTNISWDLWLMHMQKAQHTPCRLVWNASAYGSCIAAHLLGRCGGSALLLVGCEAAVALTPASLLRMTGACCIWLAEMISRPSQ